MPSRLVVNGFIFIGGLVLMLVGVRDEWADRQLVREGVLVTARVSRIDHGRRSDRITYEFKWPDARGVPQIFTDQRAAAIAVVEQAKKDGEIAVLVDPRNPARNRPANRGAAWLDLFAGVVFALVLMVLSLVDARKVFARRKKALSP